jgi:sterol desaturase/sphingolipid hydroxylase (fatty acid hydroxylase superfamily)
MDLVTDFLTRSATSLYEAGRDLLIPAAFFLCIGLIVKRGALFTDMRRAVSESSLNLQILVVNVLVVAPLITFGSGLMSDVATTYHVGLLPADTWNRLPPFVMLFIAIFLGDFVSYWRHRFEHSALLWPSHAVHHSDTEMTWLTLERFHPINRITTFVIDSGALIILGFPPGAVVANNFVRHYYGYFIHADLPWTYGPLGRIFVSPAMHRWHHAADPAAFDTNYATVFSVFDQAFGTFRVPGPCTVRLGVTDIMAPTLRSQIGYAFLPRAYRRLFGGKPKNQ